MTRNEISLLLYLETCAVDHCGRIDVRRLNEDDLRILRRWDSVRRNWLVRSGRIVAADCHASESMWCRLSRRAFRLAHAERLARAERFWRRKGYETTDEARHA